jgi:hypothetical protein
VDDPRIILMTVLVWLTQWFHRPSFGIDIQIQWPHRQEDLRCRST